MRALVAVVLAGCAGTAAVDHIDDRPAGPDRFHELLVTHDACDAAPARTVTHAAALAEMDALDHLMRRGYARYEEHHDWEPAVVELHRAISVLPDPIPIAELQRVYVAYLATSHDPAVAIGPAGQLAPAAAHRDAYAADLQVGPGREITRAADVGLVHQVVGDCAENLRPSIGTSLIVALAPGKLTCHLGAAAVALPMHRLRSAPDPERATFERTERPVVALRLRDLDEANLDALDVFVEAADVVRAAPVAVLDVRGVHGDHAATVIDFFSALIGPALRVPTADVLTSEVTLQGQINATTCLLARSDVDRDTRLALETHRRTLSQALDDAAQKPPVHTHAQPVVVPAASRQSPYQGTLVVVVDAGCSGACELFVALARQLPHAVIVGENTAGATAGERLPYRLRSSGLWLAIPASTLVPAEPATDQGYLPDLWLDTNRLDPEALAHCALDASCR
jgi:Peptidase family S41